MLEDKVRLQTVVFPNICEIPNCVSAWRILINPSSKFKHLWSIVCRRRRFPRDSSSWKRAKKSLRGTLDRTEEVF